MAPSDHGPLIQRLVISSNSWARLEPDVDADFGALTRSVVELSAEVFNDDGQLRLEQLGTAEFWVLEFGRCRASGIALWDALDAESADCEMFCDLVGDRGWSEELVAFLGRTPRPDLVIADRTTINPAWRGSGLSLVLASAALRVVGHGRGLAAMVPSPNELVAGDAGDDEIERETRRLTTLWRRLGYVEFRGSVHVLRLDATPLARQASGFVASYRRRTEDASRNGS